MKDGKSIEPYILVGGEVGGGGSAAAYRQSRSYLYCCHVIQNKGIEISLY